MGPRTGLADVEGRQILPSEPSAVQAVTSLYTDCAIPAPIWFLYVSISRKEKWPYISISNSIVYWMLVYALQVVLWSPSVSPDETISRTRLQRKGNKNRRLWVTLLSGSLEDNKASGISNRSACSLTSTLSKHLKSMHFPHNYRPNL
jgi:hypothetical protein